MHRPILHFPRAILTRKFWSDWRIGLVVGVRTFGSLWCDVEKYRLNHGRSCQLLYTCKFDDRMHWQWQILGATPPNVRRNFYSALVGERSIVISLSVCVLIVCPRAYLWNRWIDLHEILCADPLLSWLSPPLVALRCVMYFRFYEWRHVWP